MKKIRLYQYIILISCLVLGTTTCQREEEVALAELSLKNEQIEAQYTTAQLSCAFECNATFKNATIHYATNESFEEYLTQDMKKQKDGSWATTLTDLINDTVYFVRYVVANSYSSMMAEQVDTFHTKPYIAPIVANAIVIDTTAYSALISGKIESDGGLPILSCGICYSTTSEEPILADSMYIESTQIADSFVCELTNLTVVTTYYARAYAINSIGTSYSDVITFTTLSTTASLGAISTTEIGLTSATIAGEILADGGSPITDRGVCYSLVGTPTVDDQKVEMGTGIGSFTCELTDLAMGTTYYACLYAINANGTVYSAPIEFTTTTTTAEITTSPVSDITSSSAITGGTIHNDGGEKVIDRGICYATSESPSIENSVVKAGQGIGTYECTLSDLLPGTTYYVRAYASNNQGTAYGNQEQFTTLCTLASVTTTSVTYIALTEATVGGDITSDGGSEVTERGICYSTKEMPSIEDNKEIAGNGTGTYSCNLKNLLRGTTYYVRAYAINSEGIAYGNQISFSTSSVMATVVTAEPTDIGLTKATLGGEVTDDGGAIVTERGICYSNAPTPTIADTKIELGEGLGKFTHSLTNLVMGNTYYVRAYATNANGTAYGKAIAFTMGTTIPSVSTSTITNITITGATIEGNVISEGGTAVLERGVCYSKNELPTIEDMKVESGTGLGVFTCELNELDMGTTYYVRAYAKNINGTAYGEQKTFTTSSQPPVVVTADPSDITDASATVGGEVTDDRGSAITKRGVCYAITQEPTIDDSKIERGSGLGIFTGEISGLVPGTTYYVRAYATNGNGTSYGKEKSFTTDIALAIIQTIDATDIDTTTAVVGGKIITDGGATIIERGICYAKTDKPTIESNKVIGNTKEDEFVCLLKDLEISTKYYACAYATNEKGTSYGDVVVFITNSTLPKITTSNATEVTDTSAVVSGNIISDGGSTITARGICYGINPEPTLQDSHIDAGEGIGEFKCALHSLKFNTKYYARAYATNSNGIIYGNQITFTTSKTRPVVSTTQPTSIGASTATVGGNVISDGGSDVIVRGVCYSTHELPTKEDSVINNGSGIGKYTCTLSNLLSGTKYYVRAYATNGSGTAYGEVLNFDTKGSIPIVAAKEASNIAATTATINADVVHNGGADIIKRGVCYDITENPTINSNTVECGKGDGTFVADLTNLTPKTTYYARAYAVNSNGVAYSNQISFTTVEVAAVLPTLNTSSVTFIGVQKATILSTISSDGGDIITLRGVCYATTENPDVDNNEFVISEQTTNSFICTITKLQANTTYYARAFAKNKCGYAYGEQVMFTTQPLYVDLGLSVKWATCNVGANNPDEYGDYFAWGETQAKQTYSWSTYKYCLGTETSLTKYCTNSEYGIVDNKTTLELSDDAAHVNLGGDYRMPTDAEWDELSNNATWEWTILNGVHGCKVTSKLNGESIFLPATGHIGEGAYGWAMPPRRNSSTIEEAGESGTYWSSSLLVDSDTEDPTSAHNEYIQDGHSWNIYHSPRYAGQSVRPVVDEGMNISTPILTTIEATEITTTTAVLGGNITTDGGADVTVRGVCYSTSKNPTIASSKIELGMGTGTFSGEVTGLTLGTIYYARAYATNKKGTSYGNQITFSTDCLTPIIKTTEVTALTATSAKVSGNVTSDGGAAITTRGICYGTDQNPTLENKYVESEGTIGEFTCTLSNLTTATTYYARAYATNSKGTVYGEQVQFTTEAVIATLTTAVATDITINSATVGGEITSDGGATITARGVCYSTAEKPTLQDNSVDSGKGTGSFTCTLTGLSPKTKYYARAYATNEKGVAYGNQITFETTSTTATIITTEATNITATSAIVGGNITSDGGSEVIVRGICYSTNENPTTGDNKVNSGSGSGSFTCTLPGLTGNTTYYARAYATNGMGTVYGEQISFATLTVAPTVININPTNIQSTSVTLGGNVTSDGGEEVIKRGVCYSTTENPTISSLHVESGSGTGEFTCEVIGLNPKTTYYVRAYATNQKGTAYAEQISFTTEGALPVLGATSLSKIGVYCATLLGSITSNGGSEIIEKGICYGTTENPTIQDNVAIAGGSMTFTHQIVQLTENTTYYARAYAKNEMGTAYGEQVSFTTLPLYVDLGLPSGLKWATINVGANSPEYGGDFLAWGEIAKKSNYSWNTYKYGSDNYDLLKYCTDPEYGTVDGKTILELSDDVAHVSWGGNWRMPTRTEMQELINGCTLSSSTFNGVWGYKFTSKTNDNYIFLPAQGYVDETTIYDPESSLAEGRYWSSTATEDYAYSIEFDENNNKPDVTSEVRTLGYTIRPVLDENIHATAPTVTTNETTNLTTNSVTLGGNVTSDGGADVTERGVCYSTSQNPTTVSSKIELGTGTGTYSGEVTGLTIGTTYYARAYAINSKGTAYGNEITFTTKTKTPSILTTEASDVTATSAKVGGNVTSDGGSTIIERGVCYATSENPTTDNTKVTKTGTTGTFTCTLSNLANGTTYYARAYAKNANGTTYGEQVTFITLSSIGTLTTSSASSITTNSATVGGNITSDGGADITARGVCYSTTENPTIEDNKVVSGSGIGEFSCDLTGLIFSTTYYVRAYATNSNGTAYGNQITFKTLTTIPTIVTNTASNITATSATVGGNVTNDGGSTIIARGICYGINENPTISDKKVENTGTTGEYSCILDGLSATTTYYARAYATNANGTVYGEQISFTTTAGAPNVITLAATDITGTTATLGGNVISNGGADVLKRGICYATTANPTTSNKNITCGSGVGEFSCSVMDLTPNTMYYVRAYATNTKGTAYAEQISFTTQCTVPTLSATTVSYIALYSATIDGLIISNGGSTITERGICYNMTGEPTIADDAVIVGSTSNSFKETLTNLQENTTYYARAYAINSIGVAYGEEVSFTTLARYVDLDLPSRIKWATCNVGADYPEDYGDYFAWGETEPKETYDYTTYKWCDNTYDDPYYTKYYYKNTASSWGDDADGIVDNKTQLELSDDAASVNWGGNWRMPTIEEWKELINNCTWTWMTQNGVKGYKVTSMSNGNSIFLPANKTYERGEMPPKRNSAGLFNTNIYNYGYYWSSSLDTGDPGIALFMYFSSNDLWISWYDRVDGFSVRPVCP